jgi:membrane protease YdiL (CAAX protease family)
MDGKGFYRFMITFPLKTKLVPWHWIAFVICGLALTVVCFYFSPGILPLLLLWLGVIGVGIFGLAQVKANNLGLSRSGLRPSLLYLVSLWIFLQLVVVLVGVFSVTPMHFSVPYPDYLVSQLLLFALAEEIIFRGFLFPQFFLHIVRHTRSKVVSLALSLVISQVFFGMLHVSHFLVDKLSMEAIISNLAIAILWGLIGCYVYWRSRNLLFAVALHALINAPTLCYGAGTLGEMTMFAVTNLLAILLTEIWVRLAANHAAVRQQPFPSPNA